MAVNFLGDEIVSACVGQLGDGQAKFQGAAPRICRPRHHAWSLTASITVSCN